VTRTSAECREETVVAGRAEAELGMKAESPIRGWYHVARKLYGNDVHFEINFEQNTNLSGRGITQAEINRIIQTS
jgi:hypothetical protein